MPLTRDEFLAEFNAIMQNLRGFNEAENMINLQKLKNIVIWPSAEDTFE